MNNKLTPLQICIDRIILSDLEDKVASVNKIVPVIKKKGNSTPIRCLNNNMLFDSLKKAAKYARLSNHYAIKQHIENSDRYKNGIGKHPEKGELLRWEYANK